MSSLLSPPRSAAVSVAQLIKHLINVPVYDCLKSSWSYLCSDFLFRSLSVSLFPGGGSLFYITKRAMVKKDYKELDEAIKAKIQPFLYNGGKGKMVPIAQLTMIRNRDRSKSKQVIIVILKSLID